MISFNVVLQLLYELKFNVLIVKDLGYYRRQ
jgi:hypothetical protein